MQTATKQSSLEKLIPDAYTLWTERERLARKEAERPTAGYLIREALQAGQSSPERLEVLRSTLQADDESYPFTRAFITAVARWIGEGHCAGITGVPGGGVKSGPR